MSTNFYVKSTGVHIGKRSAAGSYCFTCGVTLIEGGKSKVHTDADALRACPICKRPEEKDPSRIGKAAARELGLDKSPFNFVPAGVENASSFTWAISPAGLASVRRIVDEYGTEYSTGDFLNMLMFECPLQFFHSIGREFS